MKDLYICQIVDCLSETITHTFLASNHEHAVRQFKGFLNSLVGKIHNDDFKLIIVDCVPICESYKDATDFISDCSDDCYRGDEVMKDEG